MSTNCTSAHCAKLSAARQCRRLCLIESECAGSDASGDDAEDPDVLGEEVDEDAEADGELADDDDELQGLDQGSDLQEDDLDDEELEAMSELDERQDGQPADASDGEQQSSSSASCLCSTRLVQGHEVQYAAAAGLTWCVVLRHGYRCVLELSCQHSCLRCKHHLGLDQLHSTNAAPSSHHMCLHTACLQDTMTRDHFRVLGLSAPP